MMGQPCFQLLPEGFREQNRITKDFYSYAEPGKINGLTLGHENSAGDFRLVIHSQADLPHQIIVQRKWKGKPCVIAHWEAGYKCT